MRAGVYAWLGAALFVVLVDVVACGVAVVTRHDPTPRVVQEISTP